MTDREKQNTNILKRNVLNLMNVVAMVSIMGIVQNVKGAIYTINIYL